MHTTNSKQAHTDRLRLSEPSEGKERTTLAHPCPDPKESGCSTAPTSDPQSSDPRAHPCPSFPLHTLIQTSTTTLNRHSLTPTLASASQPSRFEPPPSPLHTLASSPAAPSGLNRLTRRDPNHHRPPLANCIFCVSLSPPLPLSGNSGNTTPRITPSTSLISKLRVLRGPLRPLLSFLSISHSNSGAWRKSHAHTLARRATRIVTAPATGSTRFVLDRLVILRSRRRSSQAEIAPPVPFPARSIAIARGSAAPDGTQHTAHQTPGPSRPTLPRFLPEPPVRLSVTLHKVTRGLI